MSAKVIQVIKSEEREGLGVVGDPVRIVTRYYTLDGQLLFENDKYENKRSGKDE